MSWETELRPNVSQMKETLDNLEKRVNDHKTCLYASSYMKKVEEDQLILESIEILRKSISDILYYISH